MLSCISSDNLYKLRIDASRVEHSVDRFVPTASVISLNCPASNPASTSSEVKSHGFATPAAVKRFTELFFPIAAC